MSTGARSIPVRRGFTVVEMIIAVAAVGLISVGLAQIFRATGETVRIGKRVSNLNTYATTVERQLRKDFESITRDGFLIIHQCTAGGAQSPYTGANIKLTVDDRAPRQRRVDELQFCATGEFTSLRDPIHPARVPRATDAMIYYGHGNRQDPKDPRYFNPVALNDLNDDTTLTPRFGQPSLAVAGATGPNQYASDWTLLRQAVLLSTPSEVKQDVIAGVGVDEPGSALEEPDNRFQIGLQPAAGSPFRNQQAAPAMAPAVDPTDAQLVRDGAVERPRRSCGVVDIVSQDLPTIRAIINDAQVISQTYFNLNLDDIGSQFTIDANPASPNSSTRRMQAWMRQSLPADSGSGADSPSLSSGGRRMRYEPTPPDYLGVLGSPSGLPYAKEYQRTDQAMLTAFNFVPHCTEFIVEWSFGLVYPPQAGNALAGQMIWYGLNSTSTPDVYPYSDPRLPGNPAYGLYSMPYRKLDGSTATRPVNVNVIHGPLASALGNGSGHEYYYFGYVDPTYSPPLNDPAAPQSIPWPWPRLVRITMTIVDPTDPLNEQTFQFVFEIHASPGDKQM